MSSGGRQVSRRRLISLPGNTSQAAFSKSSLRSHSSWTGITHLTAESVKAYLYSNSWIVDEYLKESRHGYIENETDCARFTKSPVVSNTKNVNRIGSSISNLAKNLEDHNEQTIALYKLAQAIGLAASCEVVSLYLLDERLDLHLCQRTDEGINLVVCSSVQTGKTVSAYVARTGTALLSEDILGDDRFPDGTGLADSIAKSVVCAPILQTTGSFIGVLELTRSYGNPPFTQDILQMVCTFLQWSGVAIEKVQICKGLMKQREVNDFLLEVSKVIFDDIIAIDHLTEHIMGFAKNLVDADRSALFLVDYEHNELFASIFDEGREDDGKPKFSKKDEIRFSINKGFAGYVARSGEVLNIPNVYADPRFNREVDKRTGYTTRNVLCMPIVSRGIVIGVVQMLNKINGPAFTYADECNFQMFAVYCAMALHYSKIYSTIQHSEGLLKVALDQLSYHICYPEEEYNWLIKDTPVEIPHDFYKFDFNYMPILSDDLCKLFVKIIRDMFGDDCFDHEKLVRFTLSVRKNYHKVPYHNWWHAFNVAHCMYRMLDHEQEIFTELERQALIIACICHDLDHRGYTNQFMVKYETALASLYSTSVMEQHHFNQTVTILQQDGHNIFDHLTSDVYKQVLGYIRHYILATDLAQFFSNHKQVTRFCADQTFNIENTYHRNKLQAIMMSACDLSACAKTWPVQKKTVEIIYEEFYAQGDLEKKKGGVPLPMMDRDNAHNLPKEQVNFLRIFCEPLYGTLAVIFPHLSPLLENTKDNLHKWDNLAHGRPTTMWEVETSRIEKD